MSKHFLCRLIVAFILMSSSVSASVEEHDFSGVHLLASYLECDAEALNNNQVLIDVMRRAVRASGAHILDSSYNEFEPSGMTMMFLLSESHATIHTYPEFGACFVDIFTCGNVCKPEKFHQVLKAYLKPKKISCKTFLRHQDIKEKLL